MAKVRSLTELLIMIKNNNTEILEMKYITNKWKTHTQKTIGA